MAGSITPAERQRLDTAHARVEIARVAAENAREAFEADRSDLSRLAWQAALVELNEAVRAYQNVYRECFPAEKEH